MRNFLYFLVVFVALLGKSREFQGKLSEEEFCLSNLRNEKLRNSCLQTVRANLLGVSSGNVSMSFTNCSKAGHLTINKVLFNATPALNSSFGVYLLGQVNANEDLRDVVVVIYYGTVQLNTDTQPKTDVLDAGSPFGFSYNRFLPIYMSKGQYTIQFTVHNVNQEVLACVSVDFKI